ncbi:MAG: hypothetical protein DRP32_07370 [Thermotogae bacterium]|uniref:hypothetical protein n=1 Tax=Kosmotoga sp. TaxID=1955248 RepID=UPI000F2D252B|nr:hypothetical protein [Kosmotoga sp.]MCD6159356.1 hypothetical protein [Kosmotoga sp.]RKX48342.1 MAG: hypothetical protein DRP32_07370 [Thermotogota bacterium]
MVRILAILLVVMLAATAFSLSVHGLIGSELGGLNRQILGIGVQIGDGTLRAEVNGFIPITSVSDIPYLDWSAFSVMEIDPTVLLNFQLDNDLSVYAGVGLILLADFRDSLFLLYSDRAFHVKLGVNLLLMNFINVFGEVMTIGGLSGGPYMVGWSGVFSLHVGAGLEF